MSYDVKVIADSVAPHGVRLTTIQATFPRFILAEVNTHRVFSRNSASSRAIPPERMIERVRRDPFVPETFNHRMKGMGVNEELQEVARKAWISASVAAADYAGVLLHADIDKSRINRLLEPFLWHTALITATEWSNFFALRDHPDAQPEFQIIARMMREARKANTPEELAYGQWHLPYLREDELSHANASRVGPNTRIEWAHVSAGRCFTVSYDKLDEITNEDSAKSALRSRSGSARGHWSPLEHPAMAVRPGVDDPKIAWYGNFRGWRQLRKAYSTESNFQAVLDASRAA